MALHSNYSGREPVKHTWSFQLDSHHIAAVADITVKILVRVIRQRNKSDRIAERLNTGTIHIGDEVACFSIGFDSYVT